MDAFNKIVDLANKEKSGKGPGNYIPALKKAFITLLDTNSNDCAQLLLFLSDGRPSDYYKSPIFKTYEVHKMILEVIREHCLRFGDSLTFGAFGFAHDDGVMFELLKQMVLEAKNAGSKGVFSSGLDT